MASLGPVGELINEIKLAPDRKVKEQLLAQLQELALHQHSDSLDVNRSIPTIVRLLSDENANVVKRTIQAATHLLTLGLAHSRRKKSAGDAEANGDDDDGKLLPNLEQLRQRVVTLLSSENAGIASSAVNFVSSVIIALTGDDAVALQTTTYPEEALTMLRTLLSQLDATISASKATAIINTLLTVAKQRPIFMDDIIRALIPFMDSVSDAADARKKSISYTLKSALQTVSKLPAALRWVDDIHEALGMRSSRTKRALPTDGFTGDTSSSSASKRSKMGDDTNGSAAEQPFTGPPSAAIPPTYKTPSGVPISPTTFITHATYPVPLQALNIISNLNTELVAALVFENLALVPVFINIAAAVSPTTPPPPSAADATTLAPPATTATVGIPQTQLPAVPDTLDNRHLVSAVTRVVTHLKRRKPNTVDGDVAFLDDSNLAHLATLVPSYEEVTYEQLFSYIAGLLSSASTTQYGKYLLLTWITREYAGEHLTSTSDKAAPPSSLKSENGHDSAAAPASMDVDGEPAAATDEGTEAGNGSGSGRRYDMVLSRALAMFRDTLDPNHSIFSAFVFELPHLTDMVFDELARYCGDKQRNKIGLQSLRDLLLYREPIRARCLRILLEFTSHSDDAIRNPAIVQTTRLFLQPQFVKPIREHALSLWAELVVPAPAAAPSSSPPATPSSAADSAAVMAADQQPPATTGEVVVKEEPKSSDAMDVDGAPPPPPEEEAAAPTSVELAEPEIRRRMLLYFALCAKKHELLHQLVKFFVSSGPGVRKVIQREITGLIKAVGQESKELLDLIANYPEGSEPLVHHILHVLTETAIPSPRLVHTVMAIYRTRIADARFLIPILPGLSQADFVPLLPKLVVLPSSSLKAAITRLLHTKPSPLSARELFVQLHLTNPARDDVPLRKILEAMQICFEDKAVVNQDVLAGALQQLVDVSPIPALFMRTVILSVSKVKSMMNFVMGILTRLIIKQVWNDAGLWEGYMKCCKLTVPHCIPILLSLPPPQFEELLIKNPEIRPKIIDYQKNLQKGVPPSLQKVLDRLTAEAEEKAKEAAAAAAAAKAQKEAEQKEAAAAAAAAGTGAAGAGAGAEEYDPSAALED